MEYAGLFRRSIAVTVDSFFIGLLLYVGQVIATSPIFLIQRLLRPLDPATASFLTSALLLVVILTLPWLYSAKMTSSVNHATLGKLATGLAVVDCEGKPLTFRRASVRYWGSVLSLLTVGAGFLLSIFTSKRQALHDLIARTVVVRSPGPSRVFLKKGLHHLGTAVAVVVLEQVVLAPLLVSHGAKAEAFPVTQSTARNFVSIFQKTPVDETAEIKGDTYTSLLHNFTISVPLVGWKLSPPEEWAKDAEHKVFDVAISNTRGDRIARINEQRLNAGWREIAALKELKEKLQNPETRALFNDVQTALDRNPTFKEKLSRMAAQQKEEAQRQYDEAIQAAKAGPDASLWVVAQLSDKDVASLMNAVLERKRLYEDFTIETRRYVTVDGSMGSEIIYTNHYKPNPKMENFLKRFYERLNKDEDKMWKENGWGQREHKPWKPDLRPNKAILTLLKHGDYVYLFSGSVLADQARYLDEGIESIRQVIGTFRLIDRNKTLFAGLTSHGEQNERLPQDQVVPNLVKDIGQAVVAIVVSDRNQLPISSGSGFVVRPGGVIVTNFHVVEKASSITVTMANGKAYPVTQIIDINPKRDIAVIKIDGKDLPSLRVGDSHGLRAGERVLTVGNPLGFANTVSDGLYNGVRQWEDGNEWVLTTAPISAGNSGGPLLTMDGKVIGITTQRVSPKEGENLSLCVPIEEAVKLIADQPKRTFQDLIPTIGINDAKQDIAAAVKSASPYCQIDTSQCLQALSTEAYQLLTLIQSQNQPDPSLAKAGEVLESSLRNAAASDSTESGLATLVQGFENILNL